MKQQPSSTLETETTEIDQPITSRTRIVTPFSQANNNKVAISNTNTITEDGALSLPAPSFKNPDSVSDQHTIKKSSAAAAGANTNESSNTSAKNSSSESIPVISTTSSTPIDLTASSIIIHTGSRSDEDKDVTSSEPIVDVDLKNNEVISLGSSGASFSEEIEPGALDRLELWTDTIYNSNNLGGFCEIIDTNYDTNFDTGSEKSDIILPIPFEEFVEKERQVDDFFVEGDLTAAFEVLGIIDNSNSTSTGTAPITTTSEETPLPFHNETETAVSSAPFSDSLIDEELNPLDFEFYHDSEDNSDLLLQPNDYKTLFESNYNSNIDTNYYDIEKRELEREREQLRQQEVPYKSQQDTYNSNEGETNDIKEGNALYNLYHIPYQQPLSAPPTNQIKEEKEEVNKRNIESFIDSTFSNTTCHITPESFAKIQSDLNQIPESNDIKDDKALYNLYHNPYQQPLPAPPKNQTKKEKEEVNKRNIESFIDSTFDNTACLLTPESFAKIQSELNQIPESNENNIEENTEKNNNCIIVPESEEHSSQQQESDEKDKNPLESAFNKLSLEIDQHRQQTEVEEELEHPKDHQLQESNINMYSLPYDDKRGREEVKQEDMEYCLPCNDGLTLSEEESIKRVKLQHEKQQQEQLQLQQQGNSGIYDFGGLQDDTQMFTKEEILQLMNDKEGAFHYDEKINGDFFEQSQPQQQQQQGGYQQQLEVSRAEDLEKLQQQYREQQKRHQQQQKQLEQQQQQLRKQQQQLEQQQRQLQQRQQLLEQQKRQQLEQQQQPPPQNPPKPVISRRPQALKTVEPMIQSFQKKGRNERQCFGHKESIFGLSISPCGMYCASASQDSTVCIWNMKNNKLVQTLKDSELENECLRVAWASSCWGVEVFSKGLEQQQQKQVQEDSILASGGADGVVKIWRRKAGASKWLCMTTLDHKPTKKDSSPKKAEDTFLLSSMEGGKEEELEEIPQIYAIQFIDEWKLPSIKQNTLDKTSPCLSNSAVLMTSSDDFIHLWQLVSENEDEMKFETIMDIKFTHLEHGYGGVFVHLHTRNVDSTGSKSMTPFTKSTNIITNKKSYGGDRNPDNLVFVFDAAYCPANNLLGAALSDGTLRLVNGRGVCVSILQLPGCESHLTSFGWDKTGMRLATCVATGHVILWELHFGQSKDQVIPSCQAVLEGGHAEKRALFGAKFCGGSNEDLLLTWSVDGSLCVWDSYSEGQIVAPLAKLLKGNNDYPIYSVDILEQKDSEQKKNSIAIGGGKEGGFLGMPLYIYDF